MTEMPGPQELPPAFTPNGHRPSERLAGLIEELPQMLVNAFASVLRQVPVNVTGYKCAECVTARFRWVAEHKRETDAAYAAYMRAVNEVAALEDGDPRKVMPQGFAQFMPEDLRPGGASQMPPIGDGEVMVGGTVLCPDHIPGGPGTQNRSRLLVAQAGLTPSMIAQLAG
jgi:hypothetical protein